MQFEVPAISKSFYSTDKTPAMRKKLNDIDNLYGKYIRHSATISNVPEELIKSVIFIESAGNKDAVNPKSGATGLMQIMPISGTDILIMENQKKRFSQREKDLLTRLFKERASQILALKYLGQKIIVTKEDLLNPEINIFIGTIFLGILIDESTFLGNVRLDKVLHRYNKGYFADNKGTNLKGEIADIVTAANPETKDYIVKVLGKNGTLQTLLF